jgi:hypothetical protein
LTFLFFVRNMYVYLWDYLDKPYFESSEEERFADCFDLFTDAGGAVDVDGTDVALL